MLTFTARMANCEAAHAAEMIAQELPTIIDRHFPPANARPYYPCPSCGFKNPDNLAGCDFCGDAMQSVKVRP